MPERPLTPEEIAALPPEVRQAMGLTAKPERVATPEEIQAAGLPAPKPPKERKAVLRLPFMDKPSAAVDAFALRGAEAVPAGGMLTDLIGTGILQAAKKLGVGAPGAVLTPQAQAELYQLATKEGIPADVAEAQIRDPGNPIGGVGDTYRLLRDTRRKDTAKLSAENPWAGRLGEGVGTVASILAPLPGFKAAPGAGLLGRVGAASLTGAAYGGLNGLANGPSDLSRGDIKGTARDIVDNALGGAAFGAGFGLLSEGASRAWPWVRNYALGKGKEVLSGGSDIAAVTRKPLRDEAVEEVLASGGIKPFDTTPQTHQRVEQLSDEAGQLYGEIVRELEARGVPGPEVKPLADEMMARYVEAYRNSGANKGPANVFKNEANNLVDVAGGNPTLDLTQAEAIKRTMQRDAKFHRRQASPDEESLQRASSMVRQAVEDAVERGAAGSTDPEIRSLANNFIPAKQRASRLLEAEEFVDRAAAKYNQKPNVSAFDRLTGNVASGGNPIQGEINAQAMSQARRRMPSALARYSYDLSQAMQGGGVTPSVSRAIAIAGEPDLSTLLDWLSTQKPNPEEQAKALRKRKEKKE
jgi:hypothetical protein